MTGKQTYIN